MTIKKSENLEEIKAIRKDWTKMTELLYWAWEFCHDPEQLMSLCGLYDFKVKAGEFWSLYLKTKTSLEKFCKEYQLNVPIIFGKSSVASLYDLGDESFRNEDPGPLPHLPPVPAIPSPSRPTLEDIETDIKGMDLFFEECIYKLERGSLKPIKEEGGVVEPAKGGKEAKNTKPIFNLKSSEIVWEGKKCPIPPGTIEFYMCKLLFDKPFGEKVTESEIMTLVDAEKCKAEHMRTVYDAHRRINNRVKESLGIPKLLEYGAAQVWLRSEIFE